MAYTPQEQARIERFRSQHQGGVDWEMVRMTHERSVRERLRSKPDARLFAMMDGQQLEAFETIQRVHALITSGLGMKTQRFDSPGLGCGSMEYGAGMILHYRAWKEFCQRLHISPLMAEDVIVLGLSLRECDRVRKMRRHTARNNLLKCLDAWWRVDRPAAPRKLTQAEIRVELSRN